ncbi:SMP-30/gluconolactonase/LRE family protein [Bacteriovoracales bacterium]|nr:SMP-30/gluconolactonase/LRE family protein [Bacteriovoracales bacterium]
MKKIGYMVFAVILLVGLQTYFFGHMVPWNPPKDKGIQKNKLLIKTKTFLHNVGKGPEDIAIDKLGRVYVGLKDGRIIRHDRSKKEIKVLAKTEGRPLGLHLDHDENLIVADAIKGLLKIDSSGKITLLFSKFNGKEMPFLDDVTMGKDGTLYFTQASAKYSLSDHTKDFLYHMGTGKVFSLKPSGKVELLMEGLHFANGIAVDSKQEYLLINETGKYRVWKYDLKTGNKKVILENLPGFPDGISSNGKGIFWLALIDKRDVLLDKILPFPFIRSILLLLPTFLNPPRPKQGLVLGIDETGKILYDFQDPEGKVFPAVTSIQQFGDDLYLGSLRNKFYGVFSLEKKGN